MCLSFLFDSCLLGQVEASFKNPCGSEGHTLYKLWEDRRLALDHAMTPSSASHRHIVCSDFKVICGIIHSKTLNYECVRTLKIGFARYCIH